MRNGTLGERIVYLDGLRSLAILSVVVVHAAGDVFARATDSPGDWMVSAVFVGLAYWAVPCFLMISGALVLSADTTLDWARHYKKAFRRLGVPFLVWSIIYVLFYNWTGIRQVPAAAAARMIFLSTRSTAPHLWFSYVIMAMYLVAPVLRRGAMWADARPKIFRMYWILPVAVFLIAIAPNDIFAVWGVDLKPLTSIPMILVYSGYFMTGYVLHQWRTEDRPLFQWLPIVLFFSMLIYMVVYSLRLYQRGLPLSDRNVLFAYRSVPLFGMSLSVFLLAKWRDWTRWRQSRLIKEISLNSYGMYLSHMLFIKVFQKLPALEWVRHLDQSLWLLIPIKAVIVFMAAFLLTGMLRRIPRMGWLFA